MHLLSVLFIIIVNYNVENLFHPAHDSLKEDIEWTPEGERHWSYTRYYRKEENIARVLTTIGEWDGVDIVGLQEVENALCVKRLCYTLRRNEYDFVHYESPDRRGIDVALIYKKSRVDTLRTRAIRVDLGEQTTRDILYVSALIDKRDSLHLFVCHLPSQRGGKAESEWKRQRAKQVLQTAVDSVLALSPNARIVVMGLFPRGLLSAGRLEKNRQVNEILHKTIPALPYAELRDIFPQFLDKEGNADAQFFKKDLCHLCRKGYFVWYNAIADLVKKYL